MKVKTWTKDEADIYRDFLSILEKQAGWKGEVKINDTDTHKSITIACGSIISLEEFLLGKGTEHKHQDTEHHKHQDTEHKGTQHKGTQHKGMDYDEVEQLILHLGLQIMVLGTYNKGIFFLNLEDILVIDSKFFLLRNLKHVLDIEKKEQLLLSYPMKITKDDERFLAPELKASDKVLPFYASITVGYYSLAKMCMYCLDLRGYLDLQADILDPIKGSKMYFFLLRCLVVDPAERYFLYF